MASKREVVEVKYRKNLSDRGSISLAKPSLCNDEEHFCTAYVESFNEINMSKHAQGKYLQPSVCTNMYTKQHRYCNPHCTVN